MKKLLLFFVSLIIGLEVQAVDKLKGNWQTGDVKSALALAQKEQKPLFIYWGAVWCPPCNQIKKTIFTTNVFQTELAHYIAVYLDGDAPEAQVWGEYFGTVGYPTMMILSAGAKELYRMPFGLKAQEYADLMKNVRLGLSDIQTLLTKKEKTPLEWDVLALHSWEQEEKIKPDFAALERECKGKHCERFWLLSLESALDQEAFKADPKWELGLEKLLQQPQVVAANLGFFSFSAGKVLKQAVSPERREQLAKLWLQAMGNYIDEGSLSLDERLSSLYPRIEVEKLLSENKITAETQQFIKRQVDTIDVKARDQTERQSVMSTAVYLLMEVELLKAAKELALAELKKSKAPYYFMSYLASIEKKLGDEAQSLKWSREAWQNSSGHATRFQWGTSYLLSALKVNPQGTSEMQADMSVIFDEILLQKDALEGRNKRRFERLLKELKASAVGTSLFEQKCDQTSHALECQALIKALKS